MDSPARLALKSALALSLLLTVVMLFGSDIIAHNLHYVHAALLRLDDRFAILALEVTRTHQDTVISIKVTLAKAIFLNRQIVYPHPGTLIEVTTTIGSVYQPTIIAAVVAYALPRNWCASALGCLVAVAISGLMIPLDIACTLLAFAWDILKSKLDPDGFSPLLFWNDFMRSGGRQAIGLVLGLAAFRAGVVMCRAHRRLSS